MKEYNDRIEYRNELGELHRLDGPAVEFRIGTKMWYINGKLHRENGPACEYINGTKKWFRNNKLHREDGPAIEYVYGGLCWYLEGKEYFKKNFDKELLNLKLKRLMNL